MACSIDAPMLPSMGDGMVCNGGLMRKVLIVAAVSALTARCDGMGFEPAPAYRIHNDEPTTPHPIGPLPPLPKVWR